MALTQVKAEQRAQYIKQGSLSYNFNICLEKGQNYSGYAQITFALSSVPTELAVDFKGKAASRVVQNGQISQAKLTDGFIYLETGKLKEGENIIGIHYSCIYNNDGSGCVSFIDVDSKQYIYTQFESYYANRVIPCFDQPNLKAKMRLGVISPADWKKVLSNEHATVEKELNLPDEYLQHHQCAFKDEVTEYLKGKSGKVTIFPETKLLPSYLYCFIAGEYLELKLQEDKLFKNIPMSLYSIESLYEPMKQLAPFIFEITIESFKFYETFFGYPFSFNKYDQIFAHEYRWGAMENAGVVTFNDNYLFRQKVSTDRMLMLACTIAHELAHHWFGNLVTMKWWDDLWLNEAFATFISYFLLEKLKNSFKTISYETSMTSFFTRKGRGYNEDQMITTHPIRGEVINTSVADSMFDGITYCKGSASMKQFFYLMGEDNFSKAIEGYFHKYEWKNATIDEFLGEMQKYFKTEGFTLNDWKQMWLETSSLNQIEAQWDSTNTTPNSKLVIKQTPFTEKYNILRFHKIKVALYKQNCDLDVLEVLVKPQSETVVEYDGSKNYKAVLLNYEDHGYVKNTIDTVSLQFFKKNLHNVKDVLSRVLIWSSLYDMVRDAKMTSDKHVETIVAALPQEASDSLWDRVLEEAYVTINSYTPRKFRAELNSKIFNFIYDQVVKQKEDNRVTILKNKLLNFAISQEHKHVVLRWLRNEEGHLKGLELTVGQKWRIISKSFTLDDLTIEQKEQLFEQQKKADPSDTAKRYRYICDGLKSNEEEFEKIYQMFRTKDSKISVSLKSSIASGWNHSHHSERLLKYRERYFQDMQELMDKLDADHHLAFYSNLDPIDDDLEYQIEQFDKIKFPEGREKNANDVKKMVQTLRRRLRAYQLYNKASL